MSEDWSHRRSADAAAQADRLERARAREAEAAAALLTAFVADARAAGLVPEPLLARGYSRGRRYPTSLRGWYLRGDRSCAVGHDGRFHLLAVPDTLLGAVLPQRLRHAEVPASPPPLVLGRGGRDGDSIDLADALARLLG